jgi:hypothetical protein
VRDEASNMVVAIQYQTDHIHGRVRFWPDAPDFSGLRLTGDQPAIMFFMHADAYASAKHLLVEIRE